MNQYGIFDAKESLNKLKMVRSLLIVHGAEVHCQPHRLVCLLAFLRGRQGCPAWSHQAHDFLKFLWHLQMAERSVVLDGSALFSRLNHLLGAFFDLGTSSWQQTLETLFTSKWNPLQQFSVLWWWTYYFAFNQKLQNTFSETHTFSEHSHFQWKLILSVTFTSLSLPQRNIHLTLHIPMAESSRRSPIRCPGLQKDFSWHGSSICIQSSETIRVSSISFRTLLQIFADVPTSRSDTPPHSRKCYRAILPCTYGSSHPYLPEAECDYPVIWLLKRWSNH